MGNSQIFPEGVCSGQRVLEKFQKGVAQLVFSVIKKSVDPWIYVASISYERFIHPRNQTVTLRSELYTVAPELKELFGHSKSDAMAYLTSALEDRVESLTTLSAYPALVELEDGIGALLRGRYPNAAARMAAVVTVYSTKASKLPAESVQQLTARVRHYLQEADDLRIPFGSELTPPINPRSVRQLAELALLGSIVYLGYYLHRIPLNWAEQRVRSGRPETKWQIEQTLFGWAESFGIWYRNVLLGTYVILAMGLFPNLGVWSFLDALPASLAITFLYLGFGILTVKQYRKVNVARLWAFPTRRFSAHVLNSEALYRDIESLRDSE